MQQPERKEEEQYLSETVTAIDDRINSLKENIGNQKNWATELKRQYIRDLREFDEVEFVDNYSKLNEILDFTDEQVALMNKLREIREKPYFGRIDFLVKGDEEPMKIYIGLSSVDNKNKLYVIDWRAPISELFYEYGKGPASYNAPNGKIDGEITLKRQFEIENAKLLNIYDVDVNLFDEYLQHVLAQTKGDQLQSIASTIQEEQNKIIRNLKDDIIVVQGYAGCGKTTIALHRIAYALYRLPDLKSANVLFFSPNDAFLSYIAQVLPDLGEDNTRNATFPKFIKRFLKLSQPIETSDEFVSRYAFSDDSTKNVIQSKLKYEMRDKMHNWLEKLNQELRFEDGLSMEEENFTKDDLNALLEQDFKHAKYKEKLYLVANTLCNKVKAQGVEKKELIIEQLSDKFNYPMRLNELYDKFLKDFKYKPLNIDEKLYFEDAVLMCVLKELSQNVVLRTDIKHIVLDEAQDYPLLFIDFLLRIYKHSSFSIFGDVNQKTVPGELNSLQDICNLDIAKDKFSFVELDKTYRSSEEIVEYSSKLIGNPRHNAFRLKNGNPVQEIAIAKTNEQIAKQIINILEKTAGTDASVGIITGDTETAKGIYDTLIQVVDESKISFVKNAYAIAGTQIQVVPISLAKGLEFDTVILVEKGKLFEFVDKKQFLYIGATRAINKLFVLK